MMQKQLKKLDLQTNKLINYFRLCYLWQLKHGHVPIVNDLKDNSSCAYDIFGCFGKGFKLFSPSKYIMAIVVQWLERSVVVRETGVQFTPFAFSFRDE